MKTKLQELNEYAAKRIPAWSRGKPYQPADTFIPDRITEYVLVDEAQVYCKRHKLNYGRENNEYYIKSTDSRLSPFNYQFVRSNGGSYSSITGAMKSRDLYLFLKWS